MSRPKPLILIILDGWGYRAETKANAIALARKPTYDRLLREYPNTLIHTSGPFCRACPKGRWATAKSDTSTSAPAGLFSWTLCVSTC